MKVKIVLVVLLTSFVIHHALHSAPTTSMDGWFERLSSYAERLFAKTKIEIGDGNVFNVVPPAGIYGGDWQFWPQRQQVQFQPQTHPLSHNQPQPHSHLQRKPQSHYQPQNPPQLQPQGQRGQHPPTTVTTDSGPYSTSPASWPTPDMPQATRAAYLPNQ